MKNVLWAAERRFGVDDPILAGERTKERTEGAFVFKRLKRAKQWLLHGWCVAEKVHASTRSCTLRYWSGMLGPPQILLTVKVFSSLCVLRERFETKLLTTPIGRLPAVTTPNSIAGVFMRATRWRDSSHSLSRSFTGSGGINDDPPPVARIAQLAVIVAHVLSPPNVLSASSFVDVSIDDPAFTQLFSWFVIGTTAPAQSTISQNPNVLSLQFPVISADLTHGIYNLAGGFHFSGQATPKGIGDVVWITKLVADSSTQSVTGDIAVNSGTPTGAVALFHNSMLGRRVLDDGLGSELSMEFGIPNLTGTELGTLVITSAPEPSTLGLLCGSSLLFLGLRRRKKA